VGGAIEVRGGDEDDQRVLRRALDVSDDEQAVMAHVHGFHSYPARLHPETAACLVERFAPAHGRVLDPFCGSGTVLVEARRLGRHALGVDANPLAVELAHLKARGSTPAERKAVHEAAARVVDHAGERKTRRAGPTRSYGADDRRTFDAHVLLELDGLRDGVRAEAGRFERRALWLVLSSILTKLGRRAGDTSGRVLEKRIASGFAIRFFSRKVEDLLERLARFERLSGGAPPARVELGDARKLAHVEDGSIDLVVSSPPYPGVYDYFVQHAQRLRWLGLAADRFESSELGARRHFSALAPGLAVDKWQQQLGPALREMARVLRPRGRVLLVLADSVLGGRAFYADELLGRLARRTQLEIACEASQERPHFHGPSRFAFQDRPRREHLFLLERSRRKA
jgi:SAM-dependent methyltransferase